MRKFLLFAVAALFATSVSAQTSSQSKVFKVQNAQKVNKGSMKSLMGRTIKPFEGALLNGSVKMNSKLMQSEARNARPIYRIDNQTMRRAAELQSKYNGQGVNYKTKQDTAWIMQPAVATDGTPILVNVIPLPSDWAVLEYIAVPYTLEGNTIRIEPTKVAQSDSYYFYLHSWASNDGAIVLTLGEDGSLTTIDGEDIAYSIFSEDRFDLSEGGPYKGLVLDIEKVKYLMEGQKIVPVAGYEPNGLLLHPGPSVNGDYYTNVLMPAYGDIELVNWTDVKSDYTWNMQQIQYNSEVEAWEEVGDPVVSNDVNFVFNSGTNSYAPVSLVATLDGEVSAPFTWNASTWYAGGSSNDWEDSESTDHTLTFMKANPAGGLTYFNPKGCKSTILYQGKPASALFFTGVTMFIYNFVQTEGKDLVFTCKIHKAHRDPETGKFSLGELIAQADVNPEVERGTWMADQNLVRLHWDNFYVEDELGLSTDLDYLLIDDEFAVVMEGWDNETFTGYPLAFTSVCEKGGFSSTFAILPGKDTYTGAGWTGTFNALVGFTNATYGYLHTTDATDLTIPAEGGTVTISNIEPQYISRDDEGNIVTSLWIENEDEAPEWVNVQIANEVYTSTEGHFDLTFTAEALPDGVTGRTGQFVFAQRGALLKVTVTQGEATGIAATKVEVKSNNSQMFNLAGQRVNKGYKGLVIKNGRKMLNK